VDESRTTIVSPAPQVSVQLEPASQFTSQLLSQVTSQVAPAVQFTVEAGPAATVQSELLQSTSLSRPVTSSHSLDVQSKSASAPPVMAHTASGRQSTSESVVVITVHSLPSWQSTWQSVWQLVSQVAPAEHSKEHEAVVHSLVQFSPGPQSQAVPTQVQPGPGHSLSGGVSSPPPQPASTAVPRAKV